VPPQILKFCPLLFYLMSTDLEPLNSDKMPSQFPTNCPNILRHLALTTFRQLPLTVSDKMPSFIFIITLKSKALEFRQYALTVSDKLPSQFQTNCPHSFRQIALTISDKSPSQFQTNCPPSFRQIALTISDKSPSNSKTICPHNIQNINCIKLVLGLRT